MSNTCSIGLVVPFAEDRVPAEGQIMYPHVSFVARGVGVRALTPEGYGPAMAAIIPAAEALAAQGVAAIMVIGTSLTFDKGADAHRRLLENLRAATGVPVSTMSAAVVEGLRAVGATKIAVATAYDGEVNRRLAEFLTDEGFEVRAIDGFGITEFGGPERVDAQDILDLARPFEERHGIPVVSSTPAAFWAALRLVGATGRLAGYGRMLGESDGPGLTPGRQ